MNDEKLKELFREYGYLAGNPYRTDEEEARREELYKTLKATDWEPNWDPAPRMPLPTDEDVQKALEKVKDLTTAELVVEATRLLSLNSKRIERIEQEVAKLAASVKAHLELIKMVGK